MINESLRKRLEKINARLTDVEQNLEITVKFVYPLIDFIFKRVKRMSL